MNVTYAQRTVCWHVVKASKVIGAAVISTAEDMQNKPAGQADFFNTLQAKIDEEAEKVGGKYDFKQGTTEYDSALRRCGDCQCNKYSLRTCIIE